MLDFEHVWHCISIAWSWSDVIFNLYFLGNYDSIIMTGPDTSRQDAVKHVVMFSRNIYATSLEFLGYILLKITVPLPGKCQVNQVLGAVQAAGGQGGARRVRGQHAGLQHEAGRGGRGSHRPPHRHRGPAARRPGHRHREANLLHQEQRPPPVALDHRGPQVLGREAFLPTVLNSIIQFI